MKEGDILYRRGKDMCPCCNTAIYHNKTCVLGAAEREIDRLTAIAQRAGDVNQLVGQLYLSISGMTLDMARYSAAAVSRWIKEG